MSMTWLANCEGTTAWANHTWEEFASLKDRQRHLVILPLHGIADHGMGLPLDVEELIGMQYNPLSKVYSLGRDTDVNYLMRTTRNG